jgi:hypothetical protein
MPRPNENMLSQEWSFTSIQYIFPDFFSGKRSDAPFVSETSSLNTMSTFLLRMEKSAVWGCNVSAVV